MCLCYYLIIDNKEKNKMSFFQEYHIDNGALIGAILLCLNDKEILKAGDLIKIQKSLSLLDSKKGSSIYLNPDLIEEETEFYLREKVYEFDEHQNCWHLLNRKKASAYCGHYLDENIYSAVQKTLKDQTEFQK